MPLIRRKFLSLCGAALVATTLAACSGPSEAEVAASESAKAEASKALGALNSSDPLVHESTEQKEIAEDAAAGLQALFIIARTQAGDDPSAMFAAANDNIRLGWNKAMVAASDKALENLSPGGSRVAWLNDLAQKEGFDFTAYAASVEENTIFRDAAYYEESMTLAEKTAFNIYWATETNYAFGKSRALLARYGKPVYLAEPTFSEPGDVTVLDENTVEVHNFTAKVVADGVDVPLERSRGAWTEFKMVKVNGTWKIDARSFLDNCEKHISEKGADFPLDYRIDRQGTVKDAEGNTKGKLNLG